MQNRNPLDPCYIFRGAGTPVSSVSLFERQSGVQGLLTGCSDGTIKLWELDLRRPLCSWVAHSGKAILKVVALDHITFLSHGRDGVISTWLLQGNTAIAKNSFPCSDLTFCPCAVTIKNDSEQFIAFPAKGSSADKVDTVVIRKDCTRKSINLGKTHGMALQLRWYSSGECLKLFVGLESGYVALWDAETLTEEASIKLFNDPVMCLDVDDNGRFIAGSAGKELKVSSVQLTSDQYSFTEATSTATKQAGHSCAAIRKDERIVAVGGWDGRIRIFRWRTMDLLAVLRYHGETINAVVFSGDGLLAAGSKDGKVSMWNIYADKYVHCKDTG